MAAFYVVKDENYVYSELSANKGVRLTALGDKIRVLRKQRGYTLEKLAELSGSSKSYIWELENKTPPRPSADKVAKIAAVLGVTGDYLMNAGLQVEDAVDEAFYRRYRQMDPETKKKFRHMVDLWGDDK